MVCITRSVWTCSKTRAGDPANSRCGLLSQGELAAPVPPRELDREGSAPEGARLWGLAAALPSAAPGRQGRGTGRWKGSSPHLCASWSELARGLKFTGNITDTLQFLGETLWDYFKHVILQDQGPTWPSGPLGIKRSRSWPGCSPRANLGLPKHAALPLLSRCVDKPWFGYINNTGPLEAIQPLNLLTQGLSLRWGWGLMHVEWRLSHICQPWYAGICRAPGRGHGQIRATDPVQQFLYSLLLLKWQDVIKYIFLRQIGP